MLPHLQLYFQKQGDQKQEYQNTWKTIKDEKMPNILGKNTRWTHRGMIDRYDRCNVFFFLMVLFNWANKELLISWWLKLINDFQRAVHILSSITYVTIHIHLPPHLQLGFQKQWNQRQGYENSWKNRKDERMPNVLRRNTLWIHGGVKDRYDMEMELFFFLIFLFNWTNNLLLIS